MAQDSTNNNPFDIDADVDTDLLAGEAFDATTTAGAETADTSFFGDAVTAETQPTAYTASTIDTTGSYTPATVTGVDYNVANNQTTQGQLKGLIDAESPLLQQAENRALRQMHDRGLLNSSIAQQAGQAALYDYAVPIAQADANIYANAAAMNVETANTMALANQAAKNRALEFGQAMQQEGGLANMAALNNASEFNLGLKQDFYKFLISEGIDMSKFNATQKQEVNMQAAQEANTLTRQLIDNAFDARIASADAQTKLSLQQIDATTRTTLATLESNYKQLMQSTSSASDLYQQSLANIANYSDNPDLSAAALDAAIDREVQSLRTGLIMIDAFNPVIENIADLLDFTGITTGIDAVTE